MGDGPRGTAGAGYESEGRRFESCRARSPKVLQMQVFRLYRINLKVGLCHLTHHLAFSERLRRVPGGLAIWMFQFLTQSGYIIQLYLVPGYNSSSGGIEHCVFRWRKAPVSTYL